MKTVRKAYVERDPDLAKNAFLDDLEALEYLEPNNGIASLRLTLSSDGMAWICEADLEEIIDLSEWPLLAWEFGVDPIPEECPFTVALLMRQLGTPPHSVIVKDGTSWFLIPQDLFADEYEMHR